MNRLFSFLLLSLAFFACADRPTDAVEKEVPTMAVNRPDNMLAILDGQDLSPFQWMYPPETFELAAGTLRITAAKGTDFFNNPEDSAITATAPLLYQEVRGDFVATALVRPDFAETWNAAALMVHVDSTHWIKFAFENSDATGKSIVSVVTREVSDDANGVRLPDLEAVWLRLIRKGDLYALHWSADGREYRMARLTRLPSPKAVKVGMEAQCPVGDATDHAFLFYFLEHKTVEDLRKGA